MTKHAHATIRHAAGLMIAAVGSIPAFAQTQPETALVRPAHVRDVYEHHNKAAMAARSTGDWATVRRHAAAVDTLFNGNPSALMTIARAHARLGENVEALEILRAVVGMGVTRNLGGDSDLASLHALPEWASVVAGNDSNMRVIGEPRTLFALPGLDLIAEDIVWDAVRGRYLISSVRKGIIVSATPNGMTTVFAPREATGRWGVFALAIDSARSRLWATTAAMPQVEGYSPADSGKSEVLRFDLRTGSVQKRYGVPAGSRGTTLGDIAIAPNGDLFASDALSGALFVIRASMDSLEVLIPEGTFMSPQNPALSESGTRLYVADYVRGLAEVDLVSRDVKWIGRAGKVALNGIDGLVAGGPGTLIAIQNGVMPNRIIELTLDTEARTVTSVRVLAQNVASIREPTHGVIVNRQLHFIANSGWDGFRADGSPAPGATVTPPAVLAIDLDI